MDPHRRDQIQRSLRSLAESYSATMRLLEQTLQLLCEELSLDPLTYLQRRTLPAEAEAGRQKLLVDRSTLSVTFCEKTCFLGNTLPFKVLSRLARRPNAYVTYEDLLDEVWQGPRSDAAVRSVVKTLRNKLRRAGLGGLADAIDGSAPGHYALKLSP